MMVDATDNDEIEMTSRARPGRKSRVQEQRKVSWKPAAMLPDPDPEEGFAFRWIRISTLGEDDVTNLSARMREGYEPVKASEHPEVQVMGAPEGRFKDSIIIGGLMLCKIPQEIADGRTAYYREQSQSQMISVDNNFMRQSDPRMPLFKERDSKVEFGKGKV